MGVKDKRVEFWTIDEYEKFAYQAMVDPEFYYCYEVLYWCGLREGEMLALTRNDIDSIPELFVLTRRSRSTTEKIS
jgi:integrase